MVAPSVSRYEQIKTSIFFLGVLFLMAMTGGIGMGELLAAPRRAWTVLFPEVEPQEGHDPDENQVMGQV